MSVILEGHCRESDSIVVANPLIKEKTLHTEGNAVERNLGSGGRDNVQLPELVNKVHASICGRYRCVDGCRQSQADSFLVRGLNELDHWSLEEADEASSELGPDVAVQVDLDVLL